MRRKPSFWHHVRLTMLMIYGQLKSIWRSSHWQLAHVGLVWRNNGPAPCEYSRHQVIYDNRIIPFPGLVDKNEIQSDTHETVFVTFENEFDTGENQFVICENQFDRCEVWFVNFESQIITFENDFDNNKDRIVYFEADIAICETQIVTFAVHFANVENKFALSWYDIVFVSILFVLWTIHSDNLATCQYSFCAYATWQYSVCAETKGQCSIIWHTV